MNERQCKLVPVELLKDLFAGYCGPNAIGEVEDLPGIYPQPPALGDDLDDALRDMASSACQMALDNGINEEAFLRLARTVRQRIEAMLKGRAVTGVKEEVFNIVCKERDSAYARTAELEGLLKEYQWQYQEYDEHYHKEAGYRCPSCGEYREAGHRTDCDIGEALAEGAKS